MSAHPKKKIAYATTRDVIVFAVAIFQALCLLSAPPGTSPMARVKGCCGGALAQAAAVLGTSDELAFNSGGE